MKKLLSILLLCATLLPAFAQSDDFGLWTSLGAQKDISKRWSVNLGTEARFEDNVSKVTRMGLNFGITYKPIKYLRIGAGYAYMRDRYAGQAAVNYSSDENGIDYINGYNSDPSYRRDKNRAYVQVTGRYKFQRFTFSLRERVQYTHFQPVTYQRTKYRSCELTEDEADIYALTDEPFVTMQDGNTTRYFSTEPTYFMDDYYATSLVDHLKHSKHRFYLRSRLQVSYNVKGIPLEPYASFEVSNNLRDGFSLKKRRYIVGLDYTLAKRHTFGLSYVYSNGVDDDSEGNLHAISVGYTIHL